MFNLAEGSGTTACLFRVQHCDNTMGSQMYSSSFVVWLQIIFCHMGSVRYRSSNLLVCHGILHASLVILFHCVSFFSLLIRSSSVLFSTSQLLTRGVFNFSQEMYQEVKPFLWLYCLVHTNLIKRIPWKLWMWNDVCCTDHYWCSNSNIRSDRRGASAYVSYLCFMGVGSTWQLLFWYWANFI